MSLDTTVSLIFVLIFVIYIIYYIFKIGLEED